MNRNIVTKEDAKAMQAPSYGAPAGAAGAPANADSYSDRLLKYVPVEIIGAYLLIEGLLRELLKGDSLPWGLLALLLLGAVGAWLFSTQVLGVLRPVQLAMTVFAFVVWVFATGGWFSTMQFWAPGWGTIAVIVFGVMVQIVKLSPLPNPPPS